MPDRVLMNKVYPIIKKNLSELSNRKIIASVCRDYMERNSDKLAMGGPLTQIIFQEGDKDKLMEAFGLSPKFVKECMVESKDVKVNEMGQSLNTFNLSCAIAIKYMVEESKDTNTTRMLTTLYTMSFYPTVFRKYFPYDPNENIMNYVINNMSNKFKIKQLGLFKAMIELGDVCLENHKANLKKGDDIRFVKYVLDMRNRTNSMFKNIRNEYHIAHTNKKYVNLDSEDMSDENYREVENNLFIVARFTDNTVEKLILEGPTMQLITFAAKISQVSVNELRNYMVAICREKEYHQGLRDVVESILYLYLYEGQHHSEEIQGNDFLTFGLELIRQSNSQSKNLIKIKNVLDEWVNELGVTEKTKRTATINAFKRAMFIFIVLSIQLHNR